MKTVFLSSVKQKISGAVCPKCKRPAEGGTGFSAGPNSREPLPGDLVVCLYCGAVNRFNVKLQPEPVPREERRRLLRSDPKLRELVGLAEWVAREKRREWQ